MTEGETEAAQAGLLSGFKLFDAMDDAETAFRQFSKKISIGVVKKSYVINVSFEAATPEWAKHASTTYLNLAREAHIRANRTPGSQEFFAAQAHKLHDSLVALESRARDLKDRSGISSLDDQRNIVLARLGNLENRLLAVEAERSTAAAQMELCQRQLDSLGETIVTGETTGLVNTPAGECVNSCTSRKCASRSSLRV